MDRLVKPDIKEVDMAFKRGQKCTTTFRLTNLMHTMSVAVSLTTTEQSFFHFQQPFSIIPPLSTSSYTLVQSQPSDEPPLSTTTPATILVRSSMLPTGKAHQDDLRRLFAKPGPHVFKDASLPISFRGPHVAEHLILNHTQIPKVNLFLEKAISGCDVSQLTALLRSAVVCGNATLVSTLLDAGADVSGRDVDGKSMVSLAVRSGEIDITRVLIAAGGRINDSTDCVFHDAAAMNRVDLMKVLRTGFGEIDVNSVDSGGRTPIHAAAVRGNVDVIRFCVSAGGNSEIVDRNGWSPLHYAAAEGHHRAVECLLESSAYTKYAVNRDGKTAFAVAMENGHSELFDLLQLGDALHRAARVDDVHILKSCLAEGADVNGRDQNGWTPLHRAAFKGRVESVKLLLSHGAEVDAVDDERYTPLHLALEAGHAQVALELIARGARPKPNGKSLKAERAVALSPFHPVHT